MDNPPVDGWYFYLTSNPKECKIWHDGKQIKYVKRVAVDVKAGQIASVHVELVGDFKINSEFPDRDVEVQRESLPFQGQLSLFSQAIPSNLHPITLHELTEWLALNFNDHVDHDIVLFFGRNAKEINASLSYTDEGDYWYDWVDLTMPDGTIIRWSPDDGWDYPVEDALRSLWQIVQAR